MLKALSRPSDLSRRCWNFEVRDGTIKRSVKDIDRLAEEPVAIPPDEGLPGLSAEVTPVNTLPRLKITPPVTLDALLTAYMEATGISSQQATSQVLDTLAHLKADVFFRGDNLSEELVVQLCLSLGVVAEFTAPEVEGSLAGSEPVQEFQTPTGSSPETPNLLGETVKSAAAILGVDKHKLLDTLPLTYNEHSPLRDSQDIRRMLEKLGKQGAIQGGTNMRTASQAAGTANAPVAPLDIDADNLTRGLFELIESRRYLEERKAVHHYLWILEVILKNRPDIRQYLLSLPYQRLHFSTSRESILRNAEYASVFPIGRTGIYAMCTLSNQSKAQLLADILKKCGLSTAQIARIIQTL